METKINITPFFDGSNGYSAEEDGTNLWDLGSFAKDLPDQAFAYFEKYPQCLDSFDGQFFFKLTNEDREETHELNVLLSFSYDFDRCASSKSEFHVCYFADESQVRIGKHMLNINIVECLIEGCETECNNTAELFKKVIDENLDIIEEYFLAMIDLRCGNFGGKQ
jgi:hypothetical protein